MALKQKLEKLKKFSEEHTDWNAYKELWKKAVTHLQNTITQKWFQEYEQKNLMSFGIIPVKRIDAYIGEYLTTTLEITLVNNKFIILEPISAVTAEYDGKLELYMSGNLSKKVTILRKIIDHEKHDWILAKSYDPKDYCRFDKEQLEKIIEEWLA